MHYNCIHFLDNRQRFMDLRMSFLSVACCSHLVVIRSNPTQKHFSCSKFELVFIYKYLLFLCVINEPGGKKSSYKVLWCNKNKNNTVQQQFLIINICCCCCCFFTSVLLPAIQQFIKLTNGSDSSRSVCAGGKKSIDFIYVNSVYMLSDDKM